MNFCHWPTDLYTAQPYVVELSVRIVSKSERPIIPGNRKNKQKLQMKQNPTNSIKARYRVGLRAKNHIKITSDNLMLSEVIVFHLPFLRTTWDARFYRILYHILPNWNAAILGSNFYGFWRVRTAKKAAMSFLNFIWRQAQPVQQFNCNLFRCYLHDSTRCNKRSISGIFSQIPEESRWVWLVSYFLHVPSRLE